MSIGVWTRVAKELGIPRTKTIGGRKYSVATVPVSKSAAADAIKAAEKHLGVKAVSVHIGAGRYVVYHSEKRKDSKDGSEVVIRTVEEKERSRSRTSKPKMPKESRSKSGTIETRGRRGHIRL